MRTKSFADLKPIIFKIIVLAFMFGFGFLPSIGQMTPLGMRVFGIFLGSIFGWVAVSLIWTSCVGVVALGLCAYNSLGDTFAAVYGSQTAVMLLCCIFACALIAKTDLASVIVQALTSLKIAQKDPFIMSFFVFLSAWIIGTLSHCLVAGLLLLSIYDNMSAKGGVPKQHPTNSYWATGISIAATFGDLTFPFRPVAYAILGTYTAFTGQAVPFIQYEAIVLPFLFLILITYVLLGKYVLRVDMHFFNNTALFQQTTKATKKQKTALLFLGLMLIAMFLPSLFGTGTSILDVFMNKLGLGGVALICIAVMMFWQVEGKPLMDLQELSSEFQWGPYLCISYLMPLASTISSDASGITATLNGWFEPFLSVLSPMVFLSVVILLVILMTNVINNMVAAMIFITILYSLEPTLGTSLNFTAATLAIMLGAYFACLTPAANPLMAYIFTLKGLIRIKSQFMYGAISCILMYILTLCVFYPLAARIF